MSLFVSVAALVIAALALRRADYNASAQTLVSLSLGFRTCWKDFLESGCQEFEFAELFNLIEVASAAYLDRGIHGKSREILEDYLVEILRIIAQHPDARRQIIALRDEPKVFKYVKQFVIAMRRTGRIGEFEKLVLPRNAERAE